MTARLGAEECGDVLLRWTTQRDMGGERKRRISPGKWRRSSLSEMDMKVANRQLGQKCQELRDFQN